MGGFSSITGDETIMFADNCSFDGTQRSGKMTTDGQLWIGSTASNRPNNGGHVRLGSLTSPNSTITIGYSAPNITLDTAGSIATVYQEDSGTATPAAGILRILGGPGITTNGAGNTVTINSVVFTDQGGSTSVTSDSGSFATAAITLTLPASPSQGELVEFACTSASALAVRASGGQFIRIGSLISTAAGTATSTSIGDALKLRFRAADTTWYAISSIGTWLIA